MSDIELVVVSNALREALAEVGRLRRRAELDHADFARMRAHADAVTRKADQDIGRITAELAEVDGARILNGAALKQALDRAAAAEDRVKELEAAAKDVLQWGTGCCDGDCCDASIAATEAQHRLRALLAPAEPKCATCGGHGDIPCHMCPERHPCIHCRKDGGA